MGEIDIIGATPRKIQVNVNHQKLDNYNISILQVVQAIHETVHRGQQRYKLAFPYDEALTEKVRAIPGRQWSRTMKCWHIPPDTELLKDFQWQFPDGMYSANDPKAKKWHVNQPQDKTKNCKHNRPEQTNPPQHNSAGNSMNDIVGEYKQSLQMKNYSPNTIEMYVPFFREFVRRRNDKHPSELGYHEIHAYIKEKVQAENLDPGESKQLMGAIKFYYEKMLGRDKMYFNVGYQTEIEPVPTCLDAGVIIRYATDMKKPSDILLLILAYYFGYSAKEICNLTLEGAKRILKNELVARFPRLYAIFRKAIIEHYNHYTPQTFLFESKGKPLAGNQVENMVMYITTKHKIKEVYTTQLANVFEQAGYEETTFG
mgnify:CR=1 FL=1